MPVDLRCKHDREVRTRAADLFAAWRGSKSVARELRVPEGAVRKWLLTYRAVGRETLLGMGKSHTRYGWETKVAAASAVVDGGRPKPEVMAELGIVSPAVFDSLCLAVHFSTSLDKSIDANIVEHDLAVAGMRDDACFEVVADAPRRDPAEELEGVHVASEPGVLPHVQRALDVAVLRVRQRGDEQVHPRPLAGDGDGQVHRGARPVDLDGLPGLVLEVVGDVAGRDPGGVAPAERAVAQARLARGPGLVDVPPPEEPLVNADALELAVNARVVDLGHGVPRPGLLGKEEVVDLGLVHRPHVVPGETRGPRGLPDLLDAGARDAPRPRYLPCRHSHAKQLHHKLGVDPSRHTNHFLSLSGYGGTGQV